MQKNILAIQNQVGVDVREMSPSQLARHWGPVPRYVMCAGLPFGYTNAPWLFQWVMRTIAADLRWGDSTVLSASRVLCVMIVELFWVEDCVGGTRLSHPRIGIGVGV
eukprot:SAG31_NODE_2169_length_6266_cov_11.590076_1_plen_107_part_00